SAPDFKKYGDYVSVFDADGSHSGPIVGLKKAFGSGGPMYDCCGSKCSTGRVKEASSVQCFVHIQWS
ncbi:MAG: hypothetical protein ACKO9Q_02110, partial [Pirellula sp.]